MKPSDCIMPAVPCGPGQTLFCAVTPETGRCTCHCANVPTATVPTLDWPALALMGLLLALAGVRRLRAA
jgi:hypothetical protein